MKKMRICLKKNVSTMHKFNIFLEHVKYEMPLEKPTLEFKRI